MNTATQLRRKDKNEPGNGGRFTTHENTTAEATLEVWQNSGGEAAMQVINDIGRAKIQGQLDAGHIDDATLRDVIRGAMFASPAANALPSEEEMEALVGSYEAFRQTHPTLRDVARTAEVAFWRAAARRDDNGNLIPTTGSDELWRADGEIEARAGAREIRNETARIVAEDVLQRLPEPATVAQFPRLAEVAAYPQNYQDADPDRINGLHNELSTLWPRLGTPQRARANMLYTWAMHGPDED